MLSNENKSSNSEWAQSGFGMLEVMVTMLIMAFGLLALAYMKTFGFTYGQDSESRSQATVIGYEFMERIRASGIAPTDAGASAYTTVPSGNITCVSGTANATNDRNCFYLKLKERVPGSAASISVVASSTPATYQITAAWIDPLSEQIAANGSTPTNQECTDRNRLASAENNGLVWYPSSAKPSTNVCMKYVRWSIAP